MFNNFRTRYARWKKFSRTYSELQNLSDRDLADIGIRLFQTYLAR